MPEVSIIIPVYNNEAYVEKCLRSVMEQTFSDLEILVIDDGSSDGSPQILRSLSAEDTRIRLIRQENMGVSAARNRGLSAAAGKYLAFVDGDDYISSDYIEHLYKAAKAQDADMILCGLSFVDENGKILQKIIPGEYRRLEKEEWMFRISGVWSHFYRRELWTEYGVSFFEGERGEDMPISLFFSAICSKIGVLRESGYYYVQHPSSAMHNFRGLKNYSLPYRALEQTLLKVQSIGLVNSPEYYELFTLRILGTCFYTLGRGASREKMKELCDYIVRILETYFPEYYRNRLTRLFSPAEIPFSQKAAVKLLVILVRTRLIYPVSRLMSR